MSLNGTRGEFLSIVIPLYNKHDVIKETVECLSRVLKDAEFRYELIIVDDGSTDRSVDVVEEIEHELTLIKLMINSGKGFAVKKGVESARGDLVVVFDADLDINPKSIICLVEMMQESKHQIIVSSKYHPKSSVDMTFTRKQIGLIWARLMKLVTGLSVSDTQTGLKVYRIETAKHLFSELQSNRFAFEVEVLLKAERLGLSIGEGPVEISRQFKGGVGLSDGIQAIKDLFVIWKTNR